MCLSETSLSMPVLTQSQTAIKNQSQRVWHQIDLFPTEYSFFKKKTKKTKVCTHYYLGSACQEGIISVLCYKVSSYTNCVYFAGNGKNQIISRFEAPDPHLEVPLKKGQRIFSHAGVPSHQMREIRIYTITKADFDFFCIAHLTKEACTFVVQERTWNRKTEA